MLPTIRYFTAFGIALIFLFSFSIYFNFTILYKKKVNFTFLYKKIRFFYKKKKANKTNNSSIDETSVPVFYYPQSSNVRNSLKSIFKVQLWENLYYLFYGTLYFVMLFGDRLLSWIYNPVTVEAANGVILPMAFNTTYHIERNLALFIMAPAGIIQYILVAPLYQILNNKSLYLKIGELKLLINFFFLYINNYF
jgi:hypothetical protein